MIDNHIMVLNKTPPTTYPELPQLHNRGWHLVTGNLPNSIYGANYAYHLCRKANTKNAEYLEMCNNARAAERYVQDLLRRDADLEQRQGLNDTYLFQFSKDQIENMDGVDSSWSIIIQQRAIMDNFDLRLWIWLRRGWSVPVAKINTEWLERPRPYVVDPSYRPSPALRRLQDSRLFDSEVWEWNPPLQNPSKSSSTTDEASKEPGKSILSDPSMIRKRKIDLDI